MTLCGWWWQRWQWCWWQWWFVLHCLFSAPCISDWLTYFCNVSATSRCQTSSPLGQIELKLELKTLSLFFNSLFLLLIIPSLFSSSHNTHPLFTEDPEPLCNPIRTLFREIKLNKLWCEPNPNRGSYIRMRLLHRWMALGMDMDSQGCIYFHYRRNSFACELRAEQGQTVNEKEIHLNSLNLQESLPNPTV